MPVLDLLPSHDEIRIEVLKNYGRTPESVKADIESIKEWIKKQPHLPEIPSDLRIEATLITSKFQFSKAKKIFDTYYTIRGVVPEFFKDPEAPEILDINELIYWIPLRKVTKTNCRIILAKLRKRSETQQFNYEAFSAHVLNLIEILTVEDYASHKILVCDAANVQMEHVTISPLMMKKLNHIFEKVYASRVSQMHIINMPYIMEPFISLIKTFLKPKLSERMIFHKNFESVFEYLPKEIFPRDFGGEEESLETLHELWKNKSKESAPMIRKQNLLKSDESKRPEECALDSELLGLEGNFRKLNVD